MQEVQSTYKVTRIFTAFDNQIKMQNRTCTSYIHF